MDLSPDQIVRLTMLAMLAASGLELGMAFLLRAPREAGLDRD